MYWLTDFIDSVPLLIHTDLLTHADSIYSRQLCLFTLNLKTHWLTGFLSTHTSFIDSQLLYWLAPPLLTLLLLTHTSFIDLRWLYWLSLYWLTFIFSDSHFFYWLTPPLLTHTSFMDLSWLYWICGAVRDTRAEGRLGRRAPQGRDTKYAKDRPKGRWVMSGHRVPPHTQHPSLGPGAWKIQKIHWR